MLLLKSSAGTRLGRRTVIRGFAPLGGRVVGEPPRLSLVASQSDATSLGKQYGKRHGHQIGESDHERDEPLEMYMLYKDERVLALSAE